MNSIDRCNRKLYGVWILAVVLLTHLTGCFDGLVGGGCAAGMVEYDGVCIPRATAAAKDCPPTPAAGTEAPTPEAPVDASTDAPVATTGVTSTSFHAASGRSVSESLEESARF